MAAKRNFYISSTRELCHNSQKLKTDKLKIMKFCPQCSTEYEDSMFFCLEDGTPLKSTDSSVQTNPATFEQTLRMPSKEEALNLLNSNEPTGEKTLVLPAEVVTDDKSVQTEAWQAESMPPQPLPVTAETMPPQPLPVTAETNKKVILDDEKSVLTTYTESDEKRGKGLFIIAGALLGGIALIGTAIGGWLLLRDSSNEVAFTNNATKQSQNTNNNSLALSNQNSIPSNENNSISFGENDSNVSNLNSNVSLNTDSNKTTPKPSPTKDKKDSPTPAPTENPEPTATPISKTPTPVPTPTPTASSTRKPPSILSAGVLNGKAVNLVRPPYPPAARAVGASGAVSVQVLIDENGNVIRASAVSGHALLKAAAEQAARASRFSPTTLGGQAVKVTGVIVYNFVP
jgi:TonB family protein